MPRKQLEMRSVSRCVVFLATSSLQLAHRAMRANLLRCTSLIAWVALPDWTPLVTDTQADKNSQRTCSNPMAGGAKLAVWVHCRLELASHLRHQLLMRRSRSPYYVLAFRAEIVACSRPSELTTWAYWLCVWFSLNHHPPCSTASDNAQLRARGSRDSWDLQVLMHRIAVW